MKRRITKTALWILLGIGIFDLAYRYGIELLAIPTSSMGEAIEAGEYVWVNKLIPGPRFFSNSSDKYRRWEIHRKPYYNDVIVFNFPDADTVLNKKPGESYHMLRRQHPNLDSLIQQKEWGEIEYLEVNQRSRMIKRVVGLPGDSIEIRQGQLFINDRLTAEVPTTISSWRWLGSQEELRLLSDKISGKRSPYQKNNQYFINLSNREISEIGHYANYCQREIISRGVSDPFVFPYQRRWQWNSDNMGPVYLPKKGDTISLNSENVILYGRMIEVFEDTPIEIKGNYAFSNNIPVSQHIFKMDYYWVHGDNRPNSFDSRYWGPVPENHVVGVVIGR